MSAPSPAAVLHVGEIHSSDGLSHGRLLALAAAAAPGGDDPVVRAAAAALESDHHEIPVPWVGADDVDPATPQRRYTLVRVRELALPSGATRDVVVMRGAVREVLATSISTRQERSLVRRNADRAFVRGERPLAVAAAAVSDGVVGRFHLQGLVAVTPQGPHDTSDPGAAESGWTRVALWPAALRLQHWANVALIGVLSATGYYVMDPFFGPTPVDGAASGFLMGGMRLAHFVAGFAWIVLGATRFVLTFTSRYRTMRWRSFWPLWSRADLRNLGHVAQHYALIRDHSPLYLSHNPLQQLAYTGVYAACALQMATGLMLYGLARVDSPFWALVAAPSGWVGIGVVRLAHTLLMFALWAFVIMHIYLAVRADSLERHGGVSSMVNGGVWVRRGARPVDGPPIE
ncbi:Ni/Fe-hydrogenase, b-type cytochrome subunit [Xylanimonas ulmi]|uniref:Ni/Fe-hydrogenase b-type cytochrome subunit n=1 Tax=Xylanimonas ulmi TaxID=228973 RepID=A0A4V2EYF6_9MICO|nr:Ni/Fe-hydrogenase, b-type cytochrome subunit [Xylanibacterium ulmi]RZS62820.1 Ni/Fe-hydrogenase b-type cytochrome subunit [Xylanibacterium ulmi]